MIEVSDSHVPDSRLSRYDNDDDDAIHTTSTTTASSSAAVARRSQSPHAAVMLELEAATTAAATAAREAAYAVDLADEMQGDATIEDAEGEAEAAQHADAIDRHSLVYWAFVVLGVGILFPYQTFILSFDYYQVRPLDWIGLDWIGAEVDWSMGRLCMRTITSALCSPCCTCILTVSS